MGRGVFVVAMVVLMVLWKGLALASECVPVGPADVFVGPAAEPPHYPHMSAMVHTGSFWRRTDDQNAYLIDRADRFYGSGRGNPIESIKSRQPKALYMPYFTILTVA
ncbi:MAG: hypothetical protein P8102_14280, partial [Gammaproteobacteria bacterium]